jgi:hypothetical protein
MFTFDAEVGAYTQVYVNQPVWYPEGFKWVLSNPVNGKPRNGAYMEASDDGHYLEFYFWDPLMYTEENVTLLVTRALNETELSGKISGDQQYEMDYQYTDMGYTGQCKIKVQWAKKIPYYMKAYLHDRNGGLLFEFGKTWGSNGFETNCADLIGAKVDLWHFSETWDTTSVKVAEMPLLAVNGHDVLIKIHKADDSEMI